MIVRAGSVGTALVNRLVARLDGASVTVIDACTWNLYQRGLSMGAAGLQSSFDTPSRTTDRLPRGMTHIVEAAAAIERGARTVSTPGGQWRGITPHDDHALKAVDPGAKEATFTTNGTDPATRAESKSDVQLTFDDPHVSPPQRAPEMVCQSGLSEADQGADQGRVEVDQQTLRVRPDAAVNLHKPDQPAGTAGISVPSVSSAGMQHREGRPHDRTAGNRCDCVILPETRDGPGAGRDPRFGMRVADRDPAKAVTAQAARRRQGAAVHQDRVARSGGAHGHATPRRVGVDIRHGRQHARCGTKGCVARADFHRPGHLPAMAARRDHQPDRTGRVVRRDPDLQKPRAIGG